MSYPCIAFLIVCNIFSHVNIIPGRYVKNLNVFMTNKTLKQIKSMIVMLSENDKKWIKILGVENYISFFFAVIY